MTSNEMTIEELLADPLINLMMRADGVSVRRIKHILQDAAARIQTAS